MKPIIFAVTAMTLSGFLAGAPQEGAASDQQIAETVKILPKDLRAGATVVTYDPATGARKVLRQGMNFIECQTRMADGFTRCYDKALVPRRDSKRNCTPRRRLTPKSRQRWRRL